jgi:hypothetical protein
MLRAAAELGFTPAARPRIVSQAFDPSVAHGAGAKAGQKEKTEQELDQLMAKRAILN